MEKKIKELEWKGQNPDKGIFSSVDIFIGYKNKPLKFLFEIKNYAQILYLADYQKPVDSHLMRIESVEKGKEMAQKLFNNYCEEILNSILAN